MKYLAIFAAALATTSAALTLLRPDQAVLGDSQPEKYLIELSPGDTRWVTEDEKWALRRVSAFIRKGVKMFPSH